MLPKLRSLVSWCFLVVVLIKFTRAKIYERCELAKELKYVHGFLNQELSTWMCIAQHESLLDTSAMNPGSGDHGLFQISQVYWCSPPGYGCNTACEKFRDDDLTDDVRCVKKIFKEHQRLFGNGFQAWAVYPLYCNRDTSNYIEGCFENEIDNGIVLPEEEIEEEEEGDDYQFPPLPKSNSKVYGRCELAQELRYIYNFPLDQVSKWVCIVEHESNYNTSAANRGSGDHGLFQISEQYWCSPYSVGLGCNANCASFRDNNLADDIECVKHIYDEHTVISGDGFNAWAVYPLYCRGETKGYIQGCFKTAGNTLDSYEFPLLPGTEENDIDKDYDYFQPKFSLQTSHATSTLKSTGAVQSYGSTIRKKGDLQKDILDGELDILYSSSQDHSTMEIVTRDSAQKNRTNFTNHSTLAQSTSSAPLTTSVFPLSSTFTTQRPVVKSSLNFDFGKSDLFQASTIKPSMFQQNSLGIKDDINYIIPTVSPSTFGKISLAASVQSMSSLSPTTKVFSPTSIFTTIHPSTKRPVEKSNLNLNFRKSAVSQSSRTQPFSSTFRQIPFGIQDDKNSISPVESTSVSPSTFGKIHFGGSAQSTSSFPPTSKMLFPSSIFTTISPPTKNLIEKSNFNFNFRKPKVFQDSRTQPSSSIFQQIPFKTKVDKTHSILFETTSNFPQTSSSIVGKIYVEDLAQSTVPYPTTSRALASTTFTTMRPTTTTLSSSSSFRPIPFRADQNRLRNFTQFTSPFPPTTKRQSEIQEDNLNVNFKPSTIKFPVNSISESDIYKSTKEYQTSTTSNPLNKTSRQLNWRRTFPPPPPGLPGSRPFPSRPARPARPAGSRPNPPPLPPQGFPKPIFTFSPPFTEIPPSTSAYVTSSKTVKPVVKKLSVFSARGSFENSETTTPIKNAAQIQEFPGYTFTRTRHGFKLFQIKK